MMAMMNKVNEQELINVAGGNDGSEGYLCLAEPCVADGYLALRCAPCWDDSNEICKIWPGCTFYVDLNNVAYGSGCTYYFANYDGNRGWVNGSYMTILD